MLVPDIAENLKKKYSELLGLEFTHKPHQNDRLSIEFKEGKSMFFTSFTVCPYIYSELTREGFNVCSKNNCDLSWTLTKQDDEVFVSVSYTEGDVYLYFIFDEDLITPYLLRIEQDE